MAKAKSKTKKPQPKLTIATARKVLEVVDAGLVSGLGEPTPGKMCVEAAVCYALGLPHGDDPKCVGSAVRNYKIRLNDARWSSDKARAKGMREVAIAQLGSDQINQRQFADLVIVGVINQIIPITLRNVAKRISAHAQELEENAVACEGVKTSVEGGVAVRAARDTLYKARDYAADAADYAAAAAAAADAADYAADYAAAAAYASADYAALAADYAALAAADAADADAAARDSILSLAAKIAVNALKVCKSQGVKWLKLAA